MRNTPISATRLFESAYAELRSRLPSPWAVEVEREPAPNRGRRADGLFTIRAPDGTSAVLVVEANRSVDPRDVPFILEELRRFEGACPFVVAPFLGPRTRERLAGGGAGYADATGNLRLALDRPAVFIEAVGAKSNPWREERPLRTLKGPRAGRVVRALCDWRPPYGVRALAVRAGASPASVSRVVGLLEREALVTRKPRRPIEDVDWPALLRRWVEDYSLTDSNQTDTFLEPRGLQSLLDKLAGSSLTYAVTGSIAAAQVAPLAPARLAVVYVDSARKVADELGLRPAEAGTNVILAEPFDPVVFERTWEAGGITLAALSQVATDLLTSPGRGPAEAEELIAWMRRNEDAWRT